MACFTVQDLSFTYPGASRATLCNLHFTLEAGEFVTLCGPSGCGKSTLLRQLKPALAPHGIRSGSILFQGRPLEELDQREESTAIGFVLQSPENQIVTDKVWHELAFGLESLGWDTPTIRRRVAEMASFFGIQDWFHRDVASLSGGQKQLLNLASIMAMQPQVLILDEPTSQLDPIAASDFLATLGRINRELGTTILLTEHRLEEAFPLSTRVLVMDRGDILCEGSPAQVGEILREQDHSMFLAMPTPMRVYAAAPGAVPPCPVTVREGRRWLEDYAQNQHLAAIPPERLRPALGSAVVEVEEAWFRYAKDAPDIVKGLELKAYPGQLLAILGGNGAGKSTSLSLISGENRPQRGSVRCRGRVSALPQNPQTLFVKKTVWEDLLEMAGSRAEREEKAMAAAQLCRLEPLLERHPYDLSGGEQQRAALAKVLLTEPEILLLDEPTKGLDAAFKLLFAAILEELLAKGVTVIMVSHDVEFCARWADRCALFFDGAITAEAAPQAFFGGNSFYTTAANRMARQLLPEAVTAEDLILACGGSLPPGPDLPAPPPGQGADRLFTPKPAPASEETKPKKRGWWRYALGVLAGMILMIGILDALSLWDLTAVYRLIGKPYIVRPAVILVGLILLAVATFRQEPLREGDLVQPPRDQRKLRKRTIVAAVMILLLIPLTIFVGVTYLQDRKYYFISLLVILECMLPFALIFEGRKPQGRELIIIAVLCALSVVGRLAFYMLPQFKPNAAIAIIAGVAFGGESGFLVGAMGMLLSNIFVSQGPWTPWQMFSMGIIGFLGGLLFRKGLLRRRRAPMVVFGFAAVLVIYGGLMNFQTAVQTQATLTLGGLLPYYITGLPMDLIHAVATGIFLWFGGPPLLEKLDRVKVKYGLVE